MRKAQSSIDYIIVASMTFAILLPTFMLFQNYLSGSSQQSSVITAASIAREIVSNAEKVYYYGDGSKLTLEFNFPDNIESLRLHSPSGALKDQKELVFVLTSGSETTEVVKLSHVPLQLFDKGGAVSRLGQNRLSSGLKRIELLAQYDAGRTVLFVGVKIKE